MRSCALLSAALLARAASAAIDRRAVVSRHSLNFSLPSAAAIDRLDALTIGNGGFGFNVDATGLQTVPQMVSAFDLSTLSDWQFHSLPSSDLPTCALVAENEDAFLTCGASTITAVTFASFGTPSGDCGAGFAKSACDSPNSTAVAAAACVGKGSCAILAVSATFGGDPCLGTPKRLAVQVACSGPPPPPSRARALNAFRYTYFQTPVSATETVARPFATDNNISGGTASWPMVNPHRVGLGELSLRLIPAGADAAADPSMIPPAAITGIEAAMDIYAGGVASAFTLADAAGGQWAMRVATAVHPDADLVATRVECAPAARAAGGCPAALRLACPYANGQWGPRANDWEPNAALHSSTVTLNDTAGAALSIARAMDDALFTITCQWDDARWRAVRTGPHSFVLLPPAFNASAGGAAAVSLSCLWTPLDLAYPIGIASSAFVQARAATARALLAPGARLPLQPAAAAAAAAMWADFWHSGAFIDFQPNYPATADPRAAELERRVVLSRFLTRTHSAGATPPQETGLLSNSWSGKFHLEMRFWHQAHFPLWGKPELLDRSNGFYFDLLPNATSLARFQGYKGARWLKMLGLANTYNKSAMIDVPWLGTDVQAPPAWAPPGDLLLWESFNKINPILQWNQPHMIWLADVQVRAINASQGAAAAAAAAARLAPLVFATADYLASAPFFNESSGNFELGPPLLGGEEFGDYYVISRPTFETVYFAYALDVANDWRAALGLPAEPAWANVSAQMRNLPLDPAEPAGEPKYAFNAAAACCFMPAAACPPGRFGGRAQCSPLSGHPMPAGVLGMVNGRKRGDKYGVDVATANNTIRVMVEKWAVRAAGRQRASRAARRRELTPHFLPPPFHRTLRRPAGGGITRSSRWQWCG